MANPRIRVESGGRRNLAIAERLPPEAAEEMLVNYNRRYPRLMKGLARILGYRLNGTEAEVRALGRILPMVALKQEYPHEKPLIYFAMGSSGTPEIVAKIIQSFEGKPYG